MDISFSIKSFKIGENGLQLAGGSRCIKSGEIDPEVGPLVGFSEGGDVLLDILQVQLRLLLSQLLVYQVGVNIEKVQDRSSARCVPSVVFPTQAIPAR